VHLLDHFLHVVDWLNYVILFGTWSQVYRLLKKSISRGPLPLNPLTRALHVDLLGLHTKTTL